MAMLAAIAPAVAAGAGAAGSGIAAGAGAAGSAIASGASAAGGAIASGAQAVGSGLASAAGHFPETMAAGVAGPPQPGSGIAGALSSINGFLEQNPEVLQGLGDITKSYGQFAAKRNQAAPHMGALMDHAQKAMAPVMQGLQQQPYMGDAGSMLQDPRIASMVLQRLGIPSGFTPSGGQGQ